MSVSSVCKCTELLFYSQTITLKKKQLIPFTYTRTLKHSLLVQSGLARLLHQNMSLLNLFVISIKIDLNQNVSQFVHWDTYIIM